LAVLDVAVGSEGLLLAHHGFNAGLTGKRIDVLVGKSLRKEQQVGTKKRKARRTVSIERGREVGLLEGGREGGLS